tara:strand:+ start:8105 stop:8689 length:585 start_codon:yes stop_codon:yes gene_type:complete
MASKIDICNSAMNMLGASNIVSLTEDSKNARLLNQRFDFVRDAVFRSHAWNCLINRQQLNQSSTTPAYQYSYAYPIPTDPYCLRILELHTGSYSSNETDIEWKVEGRNILTDEATVYIKYIGRITDPNEYDTLLIETISARLAADTGYAITGSTTLTSSMWQLYEAKIVEARHADATEGQPDTIQAHTWINARA